MARRSHKPDLKAILDDIADRMAGESERGKVADYIPELAKANLNRFGIAVVPIGGAPVVAGDADEPFSVQSIVKVFTLTLALERAGSGIWARVGREPSGDPFNSIVQLEYEHGIPRNPFINPGAIVVADIILGKRKPQAAIEEFVGLCRRFACDESIGIDADVAASEIATGARNRALAHFMAAEGNLKNPVEDVLELYFNQCAVAMSCRQLAMSARFLASAGRLEGDDDPIITAERARRIVALMVTCGLYDASGEFAFRVGIPAKSGVGGGILGVVPGRASIAAWCPGLDEKGNSLLATRAFEELARATGWSIFGVL
ncbi:MAG TPA: glutaminase [Amaricoccus sp.]|uniref:glutaminase n=1 Tax=Amaricoccus sp. TaxID=1872485 RepID=UPI002BA7A5CC|nr:glutaminase [Amaricoccus sp.]HMQ93494.1 glutaminase [Amaricoccus sp.]HMR52183.1 glutaminase [Amaricoccus sp.]HMR59512.1 glutaminase [Amaricoccus sp.]HMT99035.1 glutaminase [Amaricoccus sp.]